MLSQKLRQSLRQGLVLGLISLLPTLAISAEVTTDNTQLIQQVESVNINQATAQELAAALQGVGIKKAQRIVDYRQKFGPFMAIDQLTAVSGISQKIVDKNRSILTLK